MSRADAERWDERYGSGEYQPSREPSWFLTRSLPLIPRGRALVIACGAGRNALALAGAGFQVDAFDIASVAIERAQAEGERRGLEVNWQVVDLDQAELEPAAYDLITMFRYMSRPLWPRLIQALAPKGWLMMEVHLKTPLEVTGPQSDEFRLETQELLSAFPGLRIVHYEETVEPSGRQPEQTALARLLACNGDPGW